MSQEPGSQSTTARDSDSVQHVPGTCDGCGSETTRVTYCGTLVPKPTCEACAPKPPEEKPSFSGTLNSQYSPSLKAYPKDSNVTEIEVPCPNGCGNMSQATVIRVQGEVLKGSPRITRLCEPCRTKALIAELGAKQRETDEQTKSLAEATKRIITATIPAHFQSFDITKVPRTSRQSVAAVIGWQYGPKGIVALGATGLCKTFAMYELIRRQIEAGRTVRCLSAYDLSLEIADAHSTFTVPAYIATLVAPDVLFVDDIGQVKFSESAEAAFLSIIDKRAAHKRPMLFTTNYNGETLLERFNAERGAPVVRRIKEFCQSIPFV